MLMQIELEGIVIDVVYKNIRHVHLRVCPPDGRVLISAPRRIGPGTLRAFAEGKLPWIRRHQKRLQAQARELPATYSDGESQCIRGKFCTLRVVEEPGASSVEWNDGELCLKVKPGSDRAQRKALLEAWCRQQLHALIPPLLERWQAVMGVRVNEWGIKKMKTRWGTCNPGARRIWLNLELIRKPDPCLELIVVHELAHLLERSHNARFKAIMDRHLPDWRRLRSALAGRPGLE